MAKADTLPVQIELSEAQYLVLLKPAPNGYYAFTGFVTDALVLRAIALVHAPEAVPAIERGLKRAREK